MRAVRSIENLAQAAVQRAARDAALMRERDNRRIVPYMGYGLLEDGTAFHVTLLDLSYDGCKIATDLVIFPGVKLQLAVDGFSGTVSARVIWHKDGHAGIKFSSSGSNQEPRIQRGHQRQAVDGQVSLRRLGRRPYQGRLFDLTPNGCKVEFIERPRAGEVLWAKFADLDAIEANVRWIDGFCGGLQFVRPLHPAIFASIMAKLAQANPLHQ